jgi:hypothetical protein
MDITIRIGKVLGLAAVALTVATSIGVPIAAADLNESQDETAQSDGTTTMKLRVTTEDGPTEYIVCTMNESYTLSYGGIFFSGRSSCTGTLASIYGRATIENTLSGNQATCNFCQSVFSSGSGSLVSGFPYAYKYTTTLQLQVGFKWVVLTPGCTRVSYPTISCTFIHDFTAE